MIRIISTIVDPNLMLIGLKLELDDKSMVAYNMQQLKQMGLNNHQMVITENTLQLKGSFKLNSIPMEVYMGGQFVPMNNSVTIVGRENNGTDDTAYHVETGSGHKAKVTIAGLRMLNDLFKPVNFVVNRRGDTGKCYLTSKPGFPKISELPIVGGVAKQLATRTYKKDVVAPNGALSFWNLCTMIDSMNGVFIRLPHVQYDTTTYMAIPADKADKVKDISEYGEFALPQPEVVITNANINLSFRAQVKVDITDPNGNKLFDIWSNKISTKTVYKHGKSNLSEIGILVKNTVKEQLFAALQGHKFGRLEDAQLRKYYAQVAGKGNADDLCIISLSLANVPAFVQADIDKMRASLPTPDAFVKNIFDYTCVKKALTELTKVKREAIKAGNGIKTVSSELSHCTPEQLAAIARAGIDTTYNSFMFKAEKTADSEDGKQTKSEYAIKWEFTKLKSVNVAANEKLAEDVKALAEVLEQYYAAKKTDEANAFIQQTKDAANAYAKVIQAWNIVMLYDGQFNCVKTTPNAALQIVPAKTNKYIVLTGSAPFEQARAAVSGWDVQ